MTIKKESSKSMRGARLVLAILIGFPITLLVGVASSQAQSTPVTACGQTLSSPGDYHLVGNLSCTANGVVITSSGVRFNLAGFTIMGTSNSGCCNQAVPQHGIHVNPAGASGVVSDVRISGGAVKGFVDGIAIEFARESSVSEMTVEGNCVFGIYVGSSQNVRLDTNVVTANHLDGVAIGASREIIVTANHITGNFRFGVEISNGETVRIIVRRNFLAPFGAEFRVHV